MLTPKKAIPLQRRRADALGGVSIVAPSPELSREIDGRRVYDAIPVSDGFGDEPAFDFGTCVSYEPLMALVQRHRRYGLARASAGQLS